MIRAVIIDDEYKAREVLKELVLLVDNDIEIVGTFENIIEGKKGIDELKPEVVFLDVDMKNGSGFDLIKLYDHVPFDIIFVTGHDKYALPAIKAAAFDFLVKPVEVTELQITLNRYKVSRQKELRSESLQQQLQLLMTTMGNQQEVKRVALPDRLGYHFVDVTDIVRCEADGNYTAIFLKNKKKMLVSKTLKDCHELLDPNIFVRVHQSYLVNKNEIITYIKNEGFYLKLTDGSTVDVSRRRKQLVEEALI